MELAFFNVQHGMSEALVRGLRSGYLGPDDYARLAACEKFDDLRSALEETDYGTFLSEDPVLGCPIITQRCWEKLAEEFHFVKAQTNQPATTILDFIAKEKMIENFVTILQGLLKNVNPKDMHEKLHPLGHFTGMHSLMKDEFDGSAKGLVEIFRIYLEETPIGPYFDDYIRFPDSNSESDPIKVGMINSGDESIANKILSGQTDFEMMMASLKKLWLEDFHKFVMALGGTTAECLGEILNREADFRCILVACNTIQMDLTNEALKKQRNSLYPSVGYLHRDCRKDLEEATSEQAVRAIFERDPNWKVAYEKIKEFYDADSKSDGSIVDMKTAEDLMYMYLRTMNEFAFEQQFHFGVYYAWIRLKEQEIRNLRWICEMMELGKQKEKVTNFIVEIFPPRPDPTHKEYGFMPSA